MTNIMSYFWILVVLAIIGIAVLAFQYWMSDIQCGRAHTEVRIARRRLRSATNAVIDAKQNYVEHQLLKK